MEKANIRKQDVYDSVLIAMLLALTGGFLDAYTYVLRGGVFATMQTGNMIMLVVKGIEFDWAYTWNYILPILSFALGVVFSEVLRDAMKKSPVKWQRYLLLIEIIILTVVAFIPNGKLNILATCLISIVASLQMNGFNKMKGHTFFSTMCTGNLSSCSVFLYRSIKNKDLSYLVKSLRYIAVIGLFVSGAFLGLMIFEFTKEYSLFVHCAILLICFCVLFFDRSEVEILPE